MTYSYPIELRERAVSAVKSGFSRKAVSCIFKININTLDNWLRKYRSTGDLSDKPRSEYKVRVVDRAKLKEFLEDHSDYTLHELAKEFGTHVSVIDYHLKKLNFTRKKNTTI